MADTETDEQLLKRFCRGDTAALGSLAARHERELLGLARALLPGRDELAADAVQDAWVRVIRFGSAFDNRSSVKTWLYRIVINRCRDLATSRKHAAPAASLDQQATDSPPATWTRPTDHTDPELNGRLHAALQTTPDSARLILILCYCRSLSHSQVADILNVPIGTLKSRLSAALAELRTRLSQEHSP